MARSSFAAAMLLAVSLVVLGCSGEEENPVVPESPSAPTLTGTWDVFIQDRAPEVSIWFELVEEGGVLSGNFVYTLGKLPLTGSCSGNDDVMIVYELTDPDIGAPHVGIFEGYAHADRTVISGTMRIETLSGGEVVYTGPFFACKQRNP